MKVSPERIARVLVLLALTTLAPATGRAVTIADTNPLFFKGPDGYGFAPDDVAKAGVAPLFEADSEDGWLVAGKKGKNVDLAVSVESPDGVVTTVVADRPVEFAP